MVRNARRAMRPCHNRPATRRGLTSGQNNFLCYRNQSFTGNPVGGQIGDAQSAPRIRQA
ncbi:hypothetical protein Amal_03767 [Acetobacter malorum]|uniref:Uncharacterized protein n=1 Tax=Acetobacter malorum TaxID=178901 RepID=A0A177G6T4_9PROT|nr:hypothetical protein Amal_03767 [Acetobacter malorum]